MKNLLTYLILLIVVAGCGDGDETEDYLENSLTSGSPINTSIEILDTSMFKHLITLPSNVEWMCIDTLDNEIIYKTCCHNMVDGWCGLYEHFYVDSNGRIVKIKGVKSGTYIDIFFEYDNNGLLKKVTDNYNAKVYKRKSKN